MDDTVQKSLQKVFNARDQALRICPSIDYTVRLRDLIMEIADHVLRDFEQVYEEHCAFPRPNPGMCEVSSDEDFDG